MAMQILGVTEKAEKDEIVKSAIELKKSEIEDGYTEEVSTCRQVAQWVQELRENSFNWFGGGNAAALWCLMFAC
jgi:hypothetical protein